MGECASIERTATGWEISSGPDSRLPASNILIECPFRAHVDELGFAIGQPAAVKTLPAHIRE
jgi:hypothetical protein